MEERRCSVLPEPGFHSCGGLLWILPIWENNVLSYLGV